MVRRRASWLMVALVVVSFVGCHTITEELGLETPTTPEAVPATVGAISIPIILPASNPTPAPAPAPTAEPPTPGGPPAATPAPPPPSPGGGGGGGGSCGLPSQSPAHSCSRTTGAFLGDVDRAIDRVVAQQPNLFNKGNDICGGCYKIKDHTAYVNAVAAQLESRGFCAFYDGEELAVKNTNNFSEQYDISTSSHHIRRGENTYRATCWPAWF